MSRTNQDKEDLDAFLTAVESKMRGPYSSLDLAKVVTTHALRGSLSPKEYLHNISRVLSRTDKVIQLRILVGLLGLDPNKETDEEVYNILAQAQEKNYEEWVRVVSGLTRGILFVEDNNEDGSLEEAKSCRGDEAIRLLDKTCREILNQTRKLEKDTENIQAEEGKPSLQKADMYPLFVSYRYSLLNGDVLDEVIPEHRENPHFQVDLDADILKMDYKLEKAKAEEAQDHKLMSAKQAVIPGATKPKAEAEQTKPEFPGFKPTKKVAPKAPGQGKASMFMPSKRPGVPAGRGGRQMPMKGALHTRKAGAAQSLLSKSRRGRGAAATASVAGPSSAVGRAQKFTNNKSKMKMIDVAEVKGLNQEHKQREEKIQKEETKEQKLLARKRKIMEAAAEKGLVAAPKIRKLEEERAKFKTSGPTMGNGDVAQQQQQQQQPQEAGSNDAGNGAAAAGGDSSNQDWQVILKERSNKLSEEDRLRVEQFFTNRYNPTPNEPIHKMKLHEERTTDPATGQAMKETYYLELDYNSFTSKQSKKIKRY